MWVTDVPKGWQLSRASILRIGTVDDFKLAETVLRLTIEQHVKHRVDWLKDIENMQQIEGQASA